MMKKWEFSGNLDSENGIKNYELFMATVIEVLQRFYNVFSPETMHKYPFLIDNALSGSGHTPIITPTLGEFLIIKLKIDDGVEKSKIIFQVAHELTHLVFFSIVGLDKEKARDDEESICTAVSLCLMSTMAPNDLQAYKEHVSKHEYDGYRKGLDVAEEHGFSFISIKNTILNYSEKIGKRT